uniref:PGG domain-containing protein n=1 Tax=Oryza glumipatula TaxID=40148 RepID=A0A0E0AKU9_9ORYZ
MAETPAAAAAVEMEFGPHPHDMLTLDGELLRVLITGDMRGGYGEHPGDGGNGGSPPHEVPPLEDRHRDPRTDGLQLTINLPDAAPAVVESGMSLSPRRSYGYLRRRIAACSWSSMARWCQARDAHAPHPARGRGVHPRQTVAVAPAARRGAGCLLGVTSNGNTALHLVASRGHAELAALIRGRAPSLVATRNRCLDTPLHCAAKAGHREVVARLLETPTGVAEAEADQLAAAATAEAALRVRNCLGATVLHEAVRHGHTEVVHLLMSRAGAAELASVASDDGVSPLYLAATTGSVRMVQELLRMLRPADDGRRSPALFTGREGHFWAVAFAFLTEKVSPELAEEILSWEPSLLTRIDSAGRSPLHFAVQYRKLDIIRLFLNTEASVARICDNDGLFPLHHAAILGSTVMIDEIMETCPDFSELVDNRGRNFLHCAVEHGQDSVVRYICQDDRFAMLLNATDSEGNTPLHLAVKYACPRVLSSLLQTARVETDIVNKDGRTAADLAHHAFAPGQSYYFLNPHALILSCLQWVRAPFTVDGVSHLPLDIKSAQGEQAQKELDDMRKSGTIASVLIATVAFAAAFTVPGGFVADDHPHARTATLARRFAFRSFVVSDTMAFVFSIVATCFLIYATGAAELPPSRRRWYSLIASGLVPLGAQFMIAAFAFGFHLVLGVANRGLLVFVYVVSSASVLLCFPGIWTPWRLGLGKATWRRARWKGLINMYQRPCSLRVLFRCIPYSFLFENIRRPLFSILITVTFFVAIALDIV